MALEVDTEAAPAGLVLTSDEIRRRIAEKAALVAELEARTSRSVTAIGGSTAPAPALTRRITADGRKLAGLASRARRLAAKAEAAAEKATLAKADADAAREQLAAYMRETGLA